MQDVAVKKKCPPVPSMTMVAIGSREWRAKRSKAGGKKVKCNPVQTELVGSEMNDDNYNNDRERKYIDRQTHLDRQLTNQQYEAELMKMQLILTSKGGTRDSLTTVYSTLINAKQFKQAEKIMTQLMAEIHAIRDIQNKVLAMQRSDWGWGAVAVGGVNGGVANDAGVGNNSVCENKIKRG